jgi:hypothetical protein
LELWLPDAAAARYPLLWPPIANFIEQCDWEICSWFGLADAYLAFTPAVVRSANCLYRCRAPRSLKALVMTDTELKLMASAAIIGESSHPVNG